MYYLYCTYGWLLTNTLKSMEGAENLLGMLQVLRAGIDSLGELINSLGELLPEPVGGTLTPCLLLCEELLAPTHLLPQSQNWASTLSSN